MTTHPSKKEAENFVKRTGEKDGFKRIIHTEIETSIDNDTSD